MQQSKICKLEIKEEKQSAIEQLRAETRAKEREALAEEGIELPPRPMLEEKSADKAQSAAEKSESSEKQKQKDAKQETGEANPQILETAEQSEQADSEEGEQNQQVIEKVTEKVAENTKEALSKAAILPKKVVELTNKVATSIWNRLQGGWQAGFRQWAAGVAAYSRGCRG